MKITAVGAELYHTDRRQTWRSFSQFCEHASNPATNSNHKKCYGRSAPLKWRQEQSTKREGRLTVRSLMFRGSWGWVNLRRAGRFLRCQVSACREKNDWMNVECWWTEMTAENRSTLKETCPSSNLTTRNPARMYLWLTQGLRSEKPANNCLRYSTTAASMFIRRPIFLSVT
jgi:hypothetical protein